MPRGFQNFFTVTKSILSILIGIAIDKKYIKSLDTRIIDLFPEYSVKRGNRRV